MSSRDLIMFMLYLDTWILEDEDIDNLSNNDIQELVKKWREEWMPGLDQIHSGDCTKQPWPCLRCQMEYLKFQSERILKELECK
jgi:hypothetical protein